MFVVTGNLHLFSDRMNATFNYESSETLFADTVSCCLFDVSIPSNIICWFVVGNAGASDVI